MKKVKGSISPPSDTQDKGTNISLKNKILSVLKWEKCTEIELNKRFVFNDSRKIISELRADGYPIADYRLPDNRKIYFLKESPQLELFERRQA